jgi:nucleoside 2-deoxyribosyltransferase
VEFFVYLAGPIAGLTYDESVDWRQYVETNIAKGIRTLSPMRFKKYLRSEVPFKNGDDYEQHPLGSRSGITARDRFDVMRSDLILANFLGAEIASIGTCIEIGWADMLRKPIVAVMDERNIHWHPIIRECAGFIVPTLDEAISVVKGVLLPGIQYEQPIFNVIPPPGL